MRDPKQSAKTQCEIVPSLICSDLCNLERELKQFEELGLTSLHVDILDGHFSPSMPIGLEVVRQVSKITSLAFDVHLMVKEHEFFINEILDIGVKRLCFHVESAFHVDRLLSKIRAAGVEAGVALQPGTPLSVLDYVVERCDFVLLMLINPGYAGHGDEGQVPYALRKVKECRDFLDRAGFDIPIEVDGRVSLEGIPGLVAAGANILVAGSQSFFRKGAERGQNLAAMQQMIALGQRVNGLLRSFDDSPMVMTSRERVEAALAHEQPDRPPIDLRFAPELETALALAVKVNEKDLASWSGQDLVTVRPIFREPASDIRYADPTMEITKDGLFLDIYGVPFRRVETELQSYMELAGKPPLANCDSIAELDDYPWPSADMWDYSNIEPALAALEAENGPAAWGHSRGVFEIAHFLRGMDNFMMDLALRPDFACALMDHILEYLLAKAELILQAGEGRFAFFEYNDDVASQRAMLISAEMWRELVKPRMGRMCDLIHSYGSKVKYHSCGSVYAIIPDLIDMGVDILNPVQPLAANMDPFALKAEFGDQLCLHGGIDIQELLPNASPDEVRKHVRRAIKELGKDGGYIIAGSHTLQADIPVENIIALVEEAKSWGQ
ncbi:MAG: ribulose-phosphate 3-epimerase [Sedimentisphaerales bacterium]|nr:ribulose-phosphate 3-epimerase [Sedimentisphaerales bacterium]